MARPGVAETAEDLYASLGPLSAGDEENDWPLLKFVDALASVLVERVHLLAQDRPDGTPGWTNTFDPDDAPDFALPWLAQFVGAVIEPGWTTEQIRDAIRRPEGWQRGTLGAMRAVVSRFLTGSKTLSITERYLGDAYKLKIDTLAAEQGTYPSEILRAILTQKPIGIRLYYNATGSETWADVNSSFASWGALDTALPTWFDVRHS